LQASGGDGAIDGLDAAVVVDPDETRGAVVATGGRRVSMRDLEPSRHVTVAFVAHAEDSSPARSSSLEPGSPLKRSTPCAGSISSSAANVSAGFIVHASTFGGVAAEAHRKYSQVSVARRSELAVSPDEDVLMPAQ
jgi:hypothetical protein